MMKRSVLTAVFADVIERKKLGPRIIVISHKGVEQFLAKLPLFALHLSGMRIRNRITYPGEQFESGSIAEFRIRAPRPSIEAAARGVRGKCRAKAAVALRKHPQEFARDQVDDFVDARRCYQRWHGLHRAGGFHGVRTRPEIRGEAHTLEPEGQPKPRDRGRGPGVIGAAARLG